MNIRAALIAHPQPTVLRQPRQGPLNDPPIDPQPAAVWRPTCGQHRGNAHRAQQATVRLRIGATVALHTSRTASWPPRFAPHWGNRLEQWHQLGDIMPIRARHQGSQRQPVGIGQKMMCTTRFAPIRGIGTGFFPHRPRRARSGYPPSPATSRLCRPRGEWPATRHGAGDTHRCGASHAHAASTSCQSRSPSPGVTSPTGYQTSVQREYPSAHCGRIPVADRLGVWGAQAVIRAR
jgi:hypothetical protein